MRERIAGCLICLVAVLTWEALAAGSRVPMRITAETAEGSALVELSQGIVGANAADTVPTTYAWVSEPSDPSVHELVEDLLPVVAKACDPAVELCQPMVVCQAEKKHAPSAPHDNTEDAGVGGVGQLANDTPSSSKPG